MGIDKTEAKYLLRELEVDDWFTAGLTFPPKTFITQSLRTLPHLEMLLRPSPKSLPSIQIKKMVEWIKENVGDEVLAEQLAGVEQEGRSYYEQCLAAHELVQQRCDALQRVLEAEDV